MNATCPVEGCPGRASTRSKMKRHFAYVHPQHTIVIAEERPTQRCHLCHMFVTDRAIRQGHTQTKECREGAKRVQRRRLQLELLDAQRKTLTVYGKPLEKVHQYTYLGRPLTATDDDWPAVRKNIGKATGRWMGISKIITKAGLNQKARTTFYRAIVHSTLLFGAES